MDKSQSPSVLRSRSSFGRLKVERVRTTRPKELVVQVPTKNPPLPVDDDDVVESPPPLRKWTRKGSETRLGSSNKGWNLKYDSPEPDSTPRTNFSSGSDFFSRKSFRDVGYSDFMIECLRKLNFQRPSHIQAMSFAPVKEGKSCILADQSGSGKTLAYLAPVIQRLRQEEIDGKSMASSQSPRLIVLVPTAELASQVLVNCRSMSKSGVPFRSMVVTGGFRQKTQLENLQQGVDVLIATPGRFMYMIKEDTSNKELIRNISSMSWVISVALSAFFGQCTLNSALIEGVIPFKNVPS
uniref:Uncharacterized protein n=1 Tax=Cannabis sativa TaxID=3483 RepID=A0A803PJF7_CANSA